MDDGKSAKFQALYRGLDRAHGIWTTAGRPRTVRTAAMDGDWTAHFNGKLGLGIVPIMDDGRCLFGAIDIDQDDIDHQELARKVRQYEMPLVVCRSKSGGAHCYTFYRTPQPAAEVQKRLAACAAKLGYGGAEIFPKQVKLAPDQVGNWINLPYFNLAKTARPGYDTDGPLDLDSFLTAAEKVQGMEGQPATAHEDSMEGAPPCLVTLMQTGITAGQRNEGLYNYAIYCKKKSPETLEDDLMAFNHKLFDRPLPVKEVQTLAKSIGRRTYGYKCSLPPINAVCNRPECLLRKFGVRPQDDSYNDLMVGSITKIETDPPRWSLEINGVDVIFSTEELMEYRVVRKLALERINVIAPPMKQEDWLALLKHRMTTMVKVEAPVDAGVEGQVGSIFLDFITIADRSRDRTDVLRGIPAKDIIDKKPVVIFRSCDFMDFVKRRRVDLPKGPEFWMAMKRLGCGHHKVRIQDKTIQVWYVAVKDYSGFEIQVPREEVEI